MNMRIPLLVLCAAGALAAADLPYAGKWKLNPARSDFGQLTVTYEQLAGGEMKVTAEGQSYTFKDDGAEYPTPWGSTASYKKIDNETWQTVEKVNGKELATGTMKLSTDHRILNVDMKVHKADGTTSDQTMVYNKVSGGAGLAGKWKTKNVKIASPGVVEISASGSDGLVVKFVDEGGTCDMKFDGKDYAATGTMWPSGWTCAVAKKGTRAFAMTWKKDTKVMFQGTFTVSGDGKTLTELETMAGSPEKVKAVYEKVQGTT